MEIFFSIRTFGHTLKFSICVWKISFWFTCGPFKTMTFTAICLNHPQWYFLLSGHMRGNLRRTWRTVQIQACLRRSQLPLSMSRWILGTDLFAYWEWCALLKIHFTPAAPRNRSYSADTSKLRNWQYPSSHSCLSLVRCNYWILSLLLGLCRLHQLWSPRRRSTP